MESENNYRSPGRFKVKRIMKQPAKQRRTIQDIEITEADDSASSRPIQPKTRRSCKVARDPLVICLKDFALIDRWVAVRREKRMDDTNLVKFVLYWYLERRGADSASEGECRCNLCSTPLTRYCKKCKTTAIGATPSAAVKNETTHSPTEQEESVAKCAFEHSSATGPDCVRGVPRVDKNGAVKISIAVSQDYDGGGGGGGHYDFAFNDGHLGGDSEAENAVDDGDNDDDNDDDNERGQWKFARPRYACPFCDHQSPKGEHVTHMKTHELLITAQTESGEYKCLECGRKFKTFEYLIKHRRMLAGEDRDRCQECKERVKSKCEIQLHKKRHKRQETQHCHWCDQTLVNMCKTEFDQHLKDHKKGDDEESAGCGSKDSLLCAQCGSSFQTKSLLETHAASEHGTERPYVCTFPNCGISFKMEKSLKHHVNFHTDKKKVCEVCGVKFQREAELKNHLQKHTGKKFACGECGRQFTTMRTLQHHQESIHLGIRKFVCSVCGKRFVAGGMLTVHMRDHTNERPFKCSLCDSAFKRKFALEKHMLRHTAQKPFRCQDCGQEYRCMSSFKKHRKKYHSESVYACQVCGACFHIPISYSFHMRMYHSELGVDDQAVPAPVPRSTAQHHLELQQAQQQLLQQLQQPQTTDDDGGDNHGGSESVQTVDCTLTQAALTPVGNGDLNTSTIFLTL